MSIPDNKKNQFARATIWSAGVNQYPELDDDNLGRVEEPQKWLDALENIQSHSEAPVTAAEIDEAIQFRSDALPAGINRLISIASASNGYEGFWDRNYRRREWGNRTDQIEYHREEYSGEWILNNQEVVEDGLIQHPYHFWPINTGGGHWNVIFMIFQTTPEHPDEFRLMSSYSIIEPRLSGGKSAMADPDYDMRIAQTAEYVDQMLERFISAYNRVERPGPPSNYERIIWVPKQDPDDDWSSGLRVIQFVWEMLERIQDMETSGIRNFASLLRPTRPYFNPDYVRLSAAGAIAARGLQREDFDARIALARVRRIRPKGRSAGPDSGPFFARGLFAPLALPEVQRIPQRFLDAVNIREIKYGTWGYTTRRELIDRERIPAVLEDSAGRYRARLQKEKDEAEGGNQGGSA
ncbi:hypothetical protein F4859DRAFT_520291 [Xylaria cf. heliscus]|nr:hypothetical protein F4859DRAFT_520291 [Xylaria cf. heliscus]